MHRILVVDDEQLVADPLGLIFRKHGFEAEVVYTAKDALARARTFSPDLLLCDINMPGRSGLELMSDFHRELPDCRVLVLTGYYDKLQGISEHIAKLRRPARVLTKPCNPFELVREAGKVLATQPRSAA